MKTRTKQLITVAIVASLVGVGTVYTTSFPEVGQTGVARKASPEIQALAESLKESLQIQTIDIGQRQASKQGGVNQMLEYITVACMDVGLEPQEYKYRADKGQQYNIVAEKKGRRPEILLVGCHYDSYRGTPSANATGSSVAALIEVMKRLKGVTTDRTVRFAFFGSGESPYRGTEAMGARVYAKECKEKGDPIEDVLILDSIGYYSSEPGSQTFLPPWSLAYPDTADFVGVFGSLGQRDLVARTLAAWGTVSDVPARGGAMPGMLSGIRSGDQDAFRAEGFNAVLITDTGSNRQIDVRTPFDNYAMLDFVAFAHVVDGLADAVAELAGR